ncbi:hypothetical protein H1P_3970001 [Hyella patelloides LEGE 07179]|uniref:Uncharacterized protein n=1 Tax=Hyella patelloides LEGE 07179 TaxID=945734 RepID=A0A563VX61_9CYAN|nr:hypothetical protein H1P_3970001 [Hyella patelloides LEGE 07179]
MVKFQCLNHNQLRYMYNHPYFWSSLVLIDNFFSESEYVK